jgi:hypothetical protein
VLCFPVPSDILAGNRTKNRISAIPGPASDPARPFSFVLPAFIWPARLAENKKRRAAPILFQNMFQPAREKGTRPKVKPSAIEKKAKIEICSVCGIPESEELLTFSLVGRTDFLICELCALGIANLFSYYDANDIKVRPGAKCFICGNDEADMLFLKPLWLSERNEEVHLCLGCIVGFLNKALDRIRDKKISGTDKTKIQNLTRFHKTYAKEWFGVFDKNARSPAGKISEGACPVCGRSETERVTVMSVKHRENDKGAALCRRCYLVARHAHSMINLSSKAENADVVCSLCGENDVSMISVPGTEDVPIRLCENCLTTKRYRFTCKKAKRRLKTVNPETVPDAVPGSVPGSVAPDTRIENAGMTEPVEKTEMPGLDVNGPEERTDETDNSSECIKNFIIEDIKIDQKRIAEDERWNFRVFLKSKTDVCSRRATSKDDGTYRKLLEGSICLFCVEKRDSILTLIEREFRSCPSCVKKFQKIIGEHQPLPRHLENQPCFICEKTHPDFASAIVGPLLDNNNIVLCDSCVDMLSSVLSETKKALKDENVEKISYRGYAVIAVSFPKRQIAAEKKL